MINFIFKELVYASMRGLEFKYNDSTLYQSVNFLIKWLQVNISFLLIVKIQCRKDI